MTLGPQLSIGLIQGANQVGSPVGPSRSSPTTTAVSRHAVDPPRRHSLVEHPDPKCIPSSSPPRVDQHIEQAGPPERSASSGFNEALSELTKP